MDNSDFSKDVRKRLIDMGLSQTSLGKKLGIRVNRVNDAIAGRREGRKYIKIIADFLGINEIRIS
jgi:ribosome-binding protein aMBF1 (putative translation factor)